MNYKFIQLLITLLLLFSFQGCEKYLSVENKIQETPSWYLKNSSNSTTIYGYASSATLNNAKSNAREDIAKSIRVKIQSSLSISTLSNNSSELNEEEFSQQTKHSISEYTNTILTGIRLDKYTQIDKTWFVRMSYINLSTIQQIKKKFALTKLKVMNSNNPLISSTFSKNLKVSFGYIPNYTIFYKNGLFFLNIQKHNFILKDTDIKQFFFSKGDETIQLNTSSKYMKDGDFFHFSITNKNDNFISLIQIDEVGKVVVHFNNLKTKQIIYPNLKLFEGLQVGIINDKDSAVEMYLAISCKEENNFAIFEQVGLNFNKRKDALRFPNLYNLINKCNYSSLIINTSK